MRRAFLNSLIMVTFASTSDALDTSRWMSSLPDNLLLSQLSIPGSHDSCSLYGGDAVRTQRLSLSEQLDAGIRILDIRCRHFRNTLPIHHGMIYQKIKFDQVRDIVIQWLKMHPQETVVMFVKDEYSEKENSRSYEQIFDWYLRGNREYWYLNDTIPKIGDVRGKIVLVRRFQVADSHILGINAKDWHDNAEFDINDGKTLIKVQDYYKVPTIVFSDLRKKWRRIEKLLNEASKNHNDISWYMNFMNGASSGAYPYSIAKGVPLVKGMNQRLRDYMKANPKGRIGSVLMDFPEYKDYTIQQLIQRNV